MDMVKHFLQFADLEFQLKENKSYLTIYLGY